MLLFRHGMRTVINPSPECHLSFPAMTALDRISITQLPFATWPNIGSASVAEETVGRKMQNKCISYHSNVDDCCVVGIWGFSLNLYHVHKTKHKNRWINTQEETDSVSISSLTP